MSHLVPPNDGDGGGSRGPAALSPAVSRYLEAAYYMIHEGETVRPGRLAEWLGVSAPTVSAAVHRLERDGWVTVAGDRSVAFTAEGARQAAAVVRRHRVVECWLAGQLGLDWVTADAEAERVAHALSDVVLERLFDSLGRPSTCPHGNRIPDPGADDASVDAALVPLVGVPAGARATVRRISEMTEHDAPDVLALLDRQGVVPGAEVTVGEQGDPAVVALRVGRRSVHLSRGTAAAVWVEVA
ncbi:MAG TPA: metal-dependent transcriptional regulator [Acidimicrobiales bacterium]|nr:metal-dependent transcriptional regulator [Acidimicrobiales bacterium]